jgi:hypothetical protein
VFLTGAPSVAGVDMAIAPIGSNGPAAVALPVNPDGSISGTLTAGALAPSSPVTWDALLDAIASDGAYLNVRTAAVPSGELRGQLGRVFATTTYTVTAGAPPAGTPALDDFFPRSLTVASGSIVRFVVYGNHTATLLPAGMAASADTGAADPALYCGTDANPCFFDGSVPLSIGPAGGAGADPLTVTVYLSAGLGAYVVHSRLQPAMVGELRVVAADSFEISSIDDIALAIAAQLGAGPAPPPVTSIYSNLLGYDVSYPDCKRLSQVPAVNPGGFAIVGANGGRMFRYNPCLTTLWQWASGFAVRSIYINTNAAAGPTEHQGATGPAGTCRKNDRVCYGYNYGYKGARAAWRYAYHQLGAGNLPQIWWLDVEINNVWYTAPDKLANRAVVQGALDFLGSPGRYGAPSMNYTVGIYSTMYQFERITGAGWRPGVPAWYATVERSHPPSLSRCTTEISNEWSFTGGPIWLVQFLPGGTDHNVGCP